MEYKYQANNDSNFALPVDNRLQNQSAKITFELSLPYQRDAQILNVNSTYNIKPFFTVLPEKRTLRETAVGDFCSRMAANLNRYDGSVSSCCKKHLDRIPQDLSASNYSAVVETYFQLSAFCFDPLNYISRPANE